MLPIEIFEYKRKWLPGYPISIHSDLRSRAKDWLKRLEKHQWEYQEYPDVYEDTICFEEEKTAQQFASGDAFLAWVVKSTRTG